MVRQTEGGVVADGDDGNVRLFGEVDGEFVLLYEKDADSVKRLCLNVFRCKDGMGMDGIAGVEDERAGDDLECHLFLRIRRQFGRLGRLSNDFPIVHKLMDGDGGFRRLVRFVEDRDGDGCRFVRRGDDGNVFDEQPVVGGRHVEAVESEKRNREDEEGQEQFMAGHDYTYKIENIKDNSNLLNIGTMSNTAD